MAKAKRPRATHDAPARRANPQVNLPPFPPGAVRFAAPAAAPPAPAAAPAVPAAALAAPRVALEPLVLPTIPDQTSFAGRNYMDMVLSSEKFVPQISVDRNGNVITPQNAPAGIFAASVPTTASKAIAMANQITRSSIIVTVSDSPTTEGASPGPAGAAPQVRPAAAAARQTVVSAVSSKAKVAGVAGPINDPSGFGANFDSPTDGQVISVTSAGAQVTVSVSVTPADNSGNAAIACTVTLDAQTPGERNVPLTRSGSNASGVVTFTSTAPLRLNASGSHMLSAVATQLNYTSTPQVAFDVQVTTIGGGGGSNGAPTLTVTSPLDGAVIAAQFGDPNSPAEAVVTFTGTATPQGRATIQSVQVQIGASSATASNATPDPTAGWAQWTADQVLVGYGSQTATVTVTDSNGSTVSQTLHLVLAPFEPRLWLYSKLMIIEDLRVTNFAGQYGRGRVLRTLSLLPGEATNISVSSYSTSETTTTDTTSIFDELSDNTSSDFDTSISNEQTDKQSSTDSQAWGITAQASASWGWGSANITGNYKSDSNSAREDLRKSVTAATQKHAAQRSSRRTVQVNAENQQTTTSGTTQAIQRQISNINVSRTLNFIFYQLNQEYISLLHLVDVRIGYVSAFLSLLDGTTKFDYQEVTLSDLPVLLGKAIRSGFQGEVNGNITDVLSNVVDYADVRHTLTETTVPTDEVTHAPAPEASYFRFRRGLVGSWVDPITNASYAVPGVIIGATNVTMRTDGVLVDSALGMNPAIDDYNAGLQQAALAQRQLANAAAQQVIDLVNNPDPNKTDAWQKTHPQELPAALTIAAANPPAAPAAGA